MTPNTPVIERPPEEQRPPAPPLSRPAQQQPPVQPPMTGYGYGYGWQPPVSPQWQQQTIRFEPTAGQRLALAIVSLFFLIPLSGVVAGIAASLAGEIPGWLVASATVMAEAAVCAAVVGVNLIFSADAFKLLRQRE